ncbi:hypothetical protein VTK73DRAFT_8342 [Phialemonium thermophilum]|uniref:Zn(2)-C6 fungal-type domain-containing protein n=1 Tax=Phialemonium thermophilum TaxID=223376 RepID=A0ABR3Y695_9PEZI
MERQDDSPEKKQPRAEALATANNGDTQPKKLNVRKRTKTGCLTCRRRRIKCDEGKPTCNNCIKSKRQCEGYNQRLTFKEPLGAFQQASVIGPSSQGFQQEPETLANSSVPAGLNPSQSGVTSAPSVLPGPLPAIAPKPPSLDLSGAVSFSLDQAYQDFRGSSSSGALVSQSPAHFSAHQHANARAHLVSSSEVPDIGISWPDSRTTSSLKLLEPSVSLGRHSSGYNAFSAELADVSVPFGRRLTSETQIQQFGASQTFLRPLASDGHDYVTTSHQPAGGEDYWDPDDEASMVDSNDEYDLDNPVGYTEPEQLGSSLARRLGSPLDLYSTQLRSFQGPLDDSVLATYQPSSTNSPLNDQQTAAVFCYFVRVTGPSLSLYERRPFDSWPLFEGRPVPKARQHIWTYTFPILAFNHPALLQAILALGSLQMAKLQGVPPTASMKHYHLSLRRIAKNYQSPQRRTQLATLAATLLLGFYEVWNSDHDKWCKHMWGARAIIKDIPLLEMTRAVVRLKRASRQQRREFLDSQLGNPFLSQADDIDGTDFSEVDASLVTQLTGRPVAYEEDGHSFAPGQGQFSSRYTERDLENYEHLSDLYWWYCKMDVYQSILGGTKLLMDYDLWTQCAPRAPFGKIDAVFGTYDHLLLLLGRLANFASLDLARKRKARRADSSTKGSNPSPPMFPGLMPSKGQVTVPTGFSPPRETTPQSENSDDLDLEESTKAAYREWEDIQKAFEIFRINLGPDFEPMGPEIGPPAHTPFGPALKYRTYSIAGIWMNYCMGQIVLQRSHPSMPPFAMLAAGMAAQKTGRWANKIGRIAAGLEENCDRMFEVSTTLGSALIESCFCLFVAGVQYQDEAQRHWSVRRMHDIARLTGWQSARQIADGCESAWTKAASVGRGPPYQRAPELELAVPPSVWINPRRIDRKIRELETDQGKFVLTKSERAHYALGLLSMEQDMDKLELHDEI